MTAEEVIAALGLRPLPLEGGYFRETYRSAGRGPDGKSAGTAIYYLLTPDTCSLLHRLPTDEVYHFYLGDAVELLLLGRDGGKIVKLGNRLEEGEVPQLVVAAGVWQGSSLKSGGKFALMGTTMAPGFEFTEWEGGVRGSLQAAHPAFAERIRLLTPEPS